jgi:hypothetical protein
LTEQTFGIESIEVDKDWFYAPAEHGLQSAAVMDASTYVIVAYRPVGGDLLAVEDTALATTLGAIAGTTGIAEQLAEASFADAGSALDYTNGLLAAYSPTQETIQFRVDVPGIKPGQLVTVDFPTLPFSRANGTWLVEEVRGDYVGTGLLTNFRYTVVAINGTRRGQWIQAWEALTATGRQSVQPSTSGVGGGSAAGGVASTVKIVTLTADQEITETAPTADGDILTVFVVQNATGGWVFNWQAASFDSTTLVDVDERPSKETIYSFKGRSGKWHQSGIAFMKP